MSFKSGFESADRVAT